MKFNDLAYQFSLIEQEPSRLAMTRLLAELLKKADPQEAQIITNLSLGQLRPSYQGSTQFNVAEKSMIGIVATCLDWPDEKVKKTVKIIGDLGQVLLENKQSAVKPTLSIKAVYKQLCQIEEISGSGSQELKAQKIIELLREVTPLSAKFIIRIILDTLRLGFSDMTLVDALSWMLVGDKSARKVIEHAYNICADIGFIALEAKREGLKVLEKQQITMNVPIRLAAAERLPTAQAVIEKIGPCIAQPKLDGFRVQIHIDKKLDPPTTRFFSRNLIDMSNMFPDLAQRLLKLPIKTCIMEGEAIAFDPHTGTFLPFQETVKRKRKHQIEQAAQEYPLQLFLFDLLFLNGKSYLDQSHKERREALADMIASITDNRIHLIEEQPIETAQELQHYFNQQMDSGLEGIVVKKPSAHYQPGKRNFNWIKFKRQEEGHLEDTLDCVILGYYAGSGKRAGFGIGAFLVGVFDKQNDRFETVAKVGTGLSDEQWMELKKKCDANKVKEHPKNVWCAKELIPDVWIRPEIVCIIRADEITKSPLHTAGKTKDTLGYALRFPRFMGYRPDKDPFDATTVHEVKRLYEDQFV